MCGDAHHARICCSEPSFESVGEHEVRKLRLHVGVLLPNDGRKEQARVLSERLHGPMIKTDGPSMDYRKGSDQELAAAVFASRIIEPMAAQRIAPDAVRQLEEIFGDLSDKLVLSNRIVPL